MIKKSDKIKLIVAIVALAGAGVLLALQYFPRPESKPVTSGPGTPSEEVTVQKDGSKVYRSGGTAHAEPPAGK